VPRRLKERRLLFSRRRLILRLRRTRKARPTPTAAAQRMMFMLGRFEESKDMLLVDSVQALLGVVALI
jgi:hypothetical protein